MFVLPAAVPRTTPLVCCGGGARSEMLPYPHLKEDLFFGGEKIMLKQKRLELSNKAGVTEGTAAACSK